MSKWIFVLFLLWACLAQAGQEIDLSGDWWYVRTDSDRDPGDNAIWEKIQIPTTLSTAPEKYVWFKRRFIAPELSRYQRAFIRFDGVKFVSEVFLNDSHVGGHFGGWEPFEIDVTRFIKHGENSLSVRVQDIRGVMNADLNAANFEGHEDVLLAPIGSKPNEVGIWQKVTLIVRQEFAITDAHIRTSWRKKRIEVDVSLDNGSSRHASGMIVCRVFDGNEEVLRFKGPTGELIPQSAARKTIAEDWDDPKLWSPNSPHLYRMRIELFNDGRISDVWESRFGFREFWVDGIYFYLNGRKVKFLATAGHPSPNSTREDAENLYKAIKSANCVAMRLHANVWPQHWYEVADEMGMLIIEESAIWCFAREYALNDDRFWTNARDHWSGIIRRDKNHPSVVMYSIENEILHVGGDVVPGCEEKLAELGSFIKSIDPTRPIMFDGDEDPGGVADVINLHYPHEFPDVHMYPNDAYWLESKTRISGYPRKEWRWSREKPLYIGEFLWCPATTPRPFTVFLGDQAYADFDLARDQAKAQVWAYQIQAYRSLDVSGMCPWTLLESGELPNPLYDAVKFAYEPNAAFIRESDTRFFEKEQVERTIYLYNDKPESTELKLRWKLYDGRDEINSGRKKFKVEPADKIVTRITLDMPKIKNVGGVKNLRLVLTVEDEETVLFKDIKRYKVFSRELLPVGNEMPIAVYEKDGSISRVLSDAGFAVTRIREPWLTEIPAKVCVIGPHILDYLSSRDVPIIGMRSERGLKLNQFVRNGGILVVLEHDSYPTQFMPVTLTDFDTNIAFKRVVTRDLLFDVEDDDLRFWRGDNAVARKLIAKPPMGAFRVLVDSGSKDGMEYAAVIEHVDGGGKYIISQLLIGEKLDSEPIAARILVDIVRYACRCTVSGITSRPIAVMDNTITDDLWNIGVKYEIVDGIPDLRDHRLLIVTSSDMSKLRGQKDEMVRYIEDGGTIIAHDLAPEQLDLLGKLIPEHRSMQRTRSVPVVLNRGDPMTEGMTNHDLYWLQEHTGEHFSRTPLDSRIADYALVEILGDLSTATVYRAEEAELSRSGAVKSPPGVSMFGTSHIAFDHLFPSSGSYVLSVFAGGTDVGGIYPRIAVYLDSRRVGTLELVQSDLRSYSCNISAPQGKHRIKLAFVNDAYVRSTGEDRNLFIDKIAIAPTQASADRELTSPAVLVRINRDRGNLLIDQIRWDGEAARSIGASRYLSNLLLNVGAEFRSWMAGVYVSPSELTPEPGLRNFSGNHRSIRMGSNGTVSRRITFSRNGIYVFQVIASGTKAREEYPEIAIWVDNSLVGAAHLSSHRRQIVTIEGEIKKGTREVRIGFTNDLWEPPEDRNLEMFGLYVFEKSG